MNSSANWRPEPPGWPAAVQLDQLARPPTIASTPPSSSSRTRSFNSSMSCFILAGLVEEPGQLLAGDPDGRTDQTALVVDRELPATGLEKPLLSTGPDGLGVEQEAVVVEEDCFWRGHRGSLFVQGQAIFVLAPIPWGHSRVTGGHGASSQAKEGRGSPGRDSAPNAGAADPRCSDVRGDARPRHGSDRLRRLARRCPPAADGAARTGRILDRRQMRRPPTGSSEAHPPVNAQPASPQRFGAASVGGDRTGIYRIGTGRANALARSSAPGRSASSSPSPT